MEKELLFFASVKKVIEVPQIGLTYEAIMLIIVDVHIFA